MSNYKILCEKQDNFFDEFNELFEHNYSCGISYSDIQKIVVNFKISKHDKLTIDKAHDCINKYSDDKDFIFTIKTYDPMYVPANKYYEYVVDDVRKKQIKKHDVDLEITENKLIATINPVHYFEHKFNENILELVLMKWHRNDTSLITSSAKNEVIELSDNIDKIKVTITYKLCDI